MPWRGCRGQTLLSFNRVGPRYRTQVARLAGKCLSPRSHLASSGSLLLFSVEHLYVHSDVLFILPIRACSAATGGFFRVTLSSQEASFHSLENIVTSRTQEKEW